MKTLRTSPRATVEHSDEAVTERLQQLLLARDYLYDAPAVYREGVIAALEAVREALARAGRELSKSGQIA